MKTPLIFMALLALGGCATQPTTLYSWGNYEPSLYSFFKNGSPEEQIKALEKDRADRERTGAKAPPGFYAHLGLLYGKVGQPTKRDDMLAKEVSLFPESAPFINNLKNNFKGVK